MDLPSMVWIGVIYVVKLGIFESMQQSYTRAYTKGTRCILTFYKFDKKCQKIKCRKLPELPYKASKIIEFYYTNPSISVRPTNTNDFQSACKGTKKIKTTKFEFFYC